MIKEKQILINLITNIIAMGFSMLISIWITPYLIDKLGLAAYGYIGLINNITIFMTVITYTLTSMVGRFLIVALEKSGPQEASKYISSALFTIFFFGALLIPFSILFSNNIINALNIQHEYFKDVRLSFVISVAAFIFNSVFLVFSTAAYSKNRLDINNGIIISSNIIRLLTLVIIFSAFSAKIWHVAFASLIQIFLAILLSIFCFKTLIPEVNFKLKFFSLQSSYDLFSSGFLNTIIILGNLFLTQIDLIIGNKFLPAETIRLYAAILMLPNSIRNIAMALSSSFTPTTISLYSSGDLDGLRKYSNQVVKFCGMIIGWPVAILCGLGIPIIKLWIGKDCSPFFSIIILMILPLTIHLSVNQLHNVHQAMNKVKIPAIASIIMGGMNIFLALFFTSTLKLGLFGIVLSGIIMSTARTAIFIPIYTSIITNQSKFAYYKGMALPIIISSITCVIGILLQKFISINTLIALLFSAFGLSTIYFLMSFGLMHSEERIYIQSKISSLLRIKSFD